ncbi:MAG: DUF2272 domain-containing protein [Alphaproteobacteria bacterium]
MSRFCILAIFLLALAAGASELSAQQAAVPRLSRDILDVLPPSERVRGAPGRMTMRPLACHSLPTAQARRRIVDIAIQEWGFFGFSVVDQSDFDNGIPMERILARTRGMGAAPASYTPLPRGGRFPALPSDEAARVATSVTGYWAATPQGAAMIARQNEAWSGPWGMTGRWADPWSAAFVCWVMCEGGLGESDQFQRASAHWTYIDQAIRARDGRSPKAAFVAYEVGEERIVPGDMLCSGRRPDYRTVAQRRRQMGVGARSHCDIVVNVDEAAGRILTIGGNVRRSVSLKIFAATRTASGILRPADPPVNADMRPLFAHLKLRADPIELNALRNSPTVKSLNCELQIVERHAAYDLQPVRLGEGAC